MNERSAESGPGRMLERLSRRPERFPGAILLAGGSEARLEREARRLAATLLCPGDDPENRCDSCRRVLSGLHPDFFGVEPEGVQIRIDRVREAIAFGAGRPYEAGRRVARVARAEQLGLEAGNALLKSLEEPGNRLRWILTSRMPEALLPTIRSRCVLVPLSSSSAAERRERWRAGGRSDDEADDLAALVPDREEADDAELSVARDFRAELVAALESGLCQRRLAALILLAESLARSERSRSRVLAEVLADAAVLAAGGSAEFLRHRAVAGPLGEIARRLGAAPLREAALIAADEPADNRRGNRRFHFEAVLLGLHRASAGMGT